MIKLTEEDHDEVMFLKESCGIHAAKKMVLKKKVLSKIAQIKAMEYYVCGWNDPEVQYMEQVNIAISDIADVLETILEEF